MKKILMKLYNKKLQALINLDQRDELEDELERKIKLNEKRNTEIVKGNVKVYIEKINESESGQEEVLHQCHYKFLIKQKDQFYLEEIVEDRKAVIWNNELIGDCVTNFAKIAAQSPHSLDDYYVRQEFQYDRLAAVQYAERWWNSHNPNYKNFEVNCTNFISQCLHAGGAPMRGYPNRSGGWWMQQNNWSYSWSVANALTNFLSISKTGLRAQRVYAAEELQPGDVICYDFQGDGRFDHTTIVVAKDQNNMPLVNAQTYNSRMRYWSYVDSTAYTPQIKYKFFRIIDDTR
ncbi:amidase domain-containing protein [Metabacillus fastidiosus]|uniref:Amidase domain-containing protein n=1 Tax=Metabacillus fastidiosus TaxID=1458 RepID=A0ABU6NUT8_9BACI|nr:amidase domain-containing protein [Metabacillus fastidiosus]